MPIQEVKSLEPVGAIPRKFTSSPNKNLFIITKTRSLLHVPLFHPITYNPIINMGVAQNQEYGQSAEDQYVYPQPKSRKRKAGQAVPSSSSQTSGNSKVVIDLTQDTPPKKRKKEPPAEKRLKRFRDHPPQSYHEIRGRALTQRMYALNRTRDDSNPEHLTETVSMAGTTGNVYTITIDKIPSCNCPHALKGNQCKHIIYVLSRVLRVPAHLEYQLAFLSSELREIFEKAPPLPTEQGDATEKDGNRKPVEGECPICAEDFEPENKREEVVYCKAACGNNVHKACFKQWAATKKGQEVTCPFCRTPWQGDEEGLKGVVNGGKVNAEGYVNVASELGMSGRRDYSTYHRQWVNRQFGYDYW